MKLVKTANGKKNKIKMSKKEWTDLGKKAGWINKKAQSAYDRWLDREDDDYDPPECPKCDGPMDRGDFVGQGMYNWDCENEDCDGRIVNDPT